MSEAGTIVKMMIFGFIIFGMLSFFINKEGHLNIELSYKDELDLLQSQYDELLEQKVPKCADCVCKEGATGVVWSVIGFILMTAGWVWLFYVQHKYDLTELKKKKGKKK